MIGSTIGDFTSPSTGDTTFRLSASPARFLILYFYPKDSTPGCTTEAAQFRDLHSEITAAGGMVLGVSRDSLRSHESFKAKLALPFDLLSDADEALCSLFQVIKEKKLYGKPVRGIERSTFVIDANRTVIGEWRAVKAPGHAQEILDFIRARQA